MLSASGREGAGRVRLGFAHVGVSDLGGKELDDPLGRPGIGRKERGSAPPVFFPIAGSSFAMLPHPIFRFSV